MKDIIKKRGKENCINELNQHTYRTGFTILDFETMESLGEAFIPRALMERLLDFSSLDIVYTDEDNNLIKELIKKYKAEDEQDLPSSYNLNNYRQRIIMTNHLINKIPKGLRSFGNMHTEGFTGLGKSTLSSQLTSSIVNQIKKYVNKDGSYRIGVLNYVTESNPMAIDKYTKIMNLSPKEFDSIVKVEGGGESCTGHLRTILTKIHEEKMKNQSKYEIKHLSTDGTYKYGMAPTVVTVDSFSALGTQRLIDKVRKGALAGKDESKQSDLMQGLQDKATFLQAGGLGQMLVEANIYVIWVAHVGGDQGVSVGASQVIYSTVNNSKYGIKTKGVPAGQSFLNDLRISFLEKNDKSDDINKKFGTSNIAFISKGLIQKNRSGEAVKGKYVPFVLTNDGAFDDNLSMLVFMTDVSGQFNFVSKTIPGIWNDEGTKLRSISAGKEVIKLVNNPFEMMIVKLNIFKENYLEKFYASDKIKEKLALSNIVNGDTDWGLMDEYASFELPEDVIDEVIEA